MRERIASEEAKLAQQARETRRAMEAEAQRIRHEFDEHQRVSEANATRLHEQQTADAESAA